MSLAVTTHVCFFHYIISFYHYLGVIVDGISELLTVFIKV